MKPQSSDTTLLSDDENIQSVMDGMGSLPRWKQTKLSRVLAGIYRKPHWSDWVLARVFLLQCYVTVSWRKLWGPLFPWEEK